MKYTSWFWRMATLNVAYKAVLRSLRIVTDSDFYFLSLSLPTSLSPLSPLSSLFPHLISPAPLQPPEICPQCYITNRIEEYSMELQKINQRSPWESTTGTDSNIKQHRGIVCLQPILLRAGVNFKTPQLMFSM